MLWRLHLLDGDLRFISEVHGEDGEARNGLQFDRELTDADRDGRRRQPLVGAIPDLPVIGVEALRAVGIPA